VKQHTSQSVLVLLVLTDKELVDRAKSGQRRAFEALVQRHHSSLRTWLSRVTIDADLVDDIAQEALLKAWQNLGRWNQSGSFRSWLFGVALNTAKDAYRSRMRSKVRDLNWLDFATETPMDHQNAAVAALDVDRLLAILPDAQRLVVSLCYGAGFSHQEAASALNIPLGTVKSHLLRARATMMTALSEDNLKQPREGLKHD
jgi:RNA polymerase sigma factor (sigma-70 family)